MRYAALLLLALTGCISFKRLEIVIDLVAHRATFHFVDLASDEAPQDAKRIRAYERGEELIEITNLLDVYYVESKTHTVRKADTGLLEGDLAVAFDHLYEVGISSVDAAHPYRFCTFSLLGTPILATNAAARDRRGCVVWNADAKLLKITLGYADETKVNHRTDLLRSLDATRADGTVTTPPDRPAR